MLHSEVSELGLHICSSLSVPIFRVIKIPSDMCAQRGLKSVYVSVHSLIIIGYPHEETLHPWLSKMHPVKILIRLRECAGWSESWLGAHVRRYIFWCCGLHDLGLHYLLRPVCLTTLNLQLIRPTVSTNNISSCFHCIINYALELCYTIPFLSPYKITYFKSKWPFKVTLT